MDNQDLTLERRLQGKDETIAELLEALEYVDTWNVMKAHKEFCYVCGNHKTRGHHHSCYVQQVAEAIRKAKENER